MAGDDGDLRRRDGAPGRGQRRADPRGARHRALGRRRRADPVTELRTPGTLELRDVSFGYPGAETPVLDGDLASASCPARRPRSSAAPARARRRWSTWSPACSTRPPAPVLIGGVDVRELDPDILWHRIGLVPQRPYLFTGTVASNLRYGKPDATDEELWAALEVAAGQRLRDRHGRPRRADRPGRDQRLGRPAPAAEHRPGARPAARRLHLRRLVLGARPGDRRPAARRPRPLHGRVHGARRGPAGLDDHERRPDPGPRGRPARSGSGPTASSLETCPTYAEIVASQANAEDAA